MTFGIWLAFAPAVAALLLIPGPSIGLALLRSAAP